MRDNSQALNQLGLPFASDAQVSRSSYWEANLFANPTNRRVVESYLRTHPEVKPLLNEEPVNTRWFNGQRRLLRPEATVGVPFDLEDDPFMASETLRQLNNTLKAKNYEVVLGVNTEVSFPLDGEIIAEHYRRYESLTKHLWHNRNLFSRLSVRSFFTLINNRNMNKVWGKIVQIPICDAVALNRMCNYPIIRFDADSAGIKYRALPEMAAAIRNNEAHLVKVPVSFRYTRDYAQGSLNYALSYMSYAERQAHTVTNIYALAKDLIENQLHDTEERTYDEESGSGAQLINWMRVLTIARLNDPEQNSDDGENKTFLRIAKLALNSDIAPIKYIDRKVAVHHTLHRRIQKLAAVLRPWQIPLYEDGPEYQTHVQMSRNLSETPPQLRTVEDVMAMIGIMLLRQERVSGRTITLPPGSRYKLLKTIARGTFRQNRWQLESYNDWVAEARRLGAYYLKLSEEGPERQ